jgi:serine/threonine protein kinase
LGLRYTENLNSMCRLMCGTPLYIAPEIFFRQVYSEAADMPLLGVIVSCSASLSSTCWCGARRLMISITTCCASCLKPKPSSSRSTLASATLIDIRGAKDFLSSMVDKDADNGVSAHQALEHKWLKGSRRTASEARPDGAQSAIKQLFVGPDDDLHSP